MQHPLDVLANVPLTEDILRGLLLEVYERNTKLEARISKLETFRLLCIGGMLVLAALGGAGLWRAFS